jgi:hypothetical protein
MMKYWRIVTATVFLIICALFLTLLGRMRPVQYGFTYSASYAENFGLDPVDSFKQIISEFPALRFVRIPVYWNRYEPLNDFYATEELDALLDLAEQHGVEVVLAIGQKVPRWPECYVPDWGEDLRGIEFREEFLAFSEHIISEYKDHPALARWQVENESYFPFGDCETQPELITEQVELVRELDPQKSIQTTVSGEQAIALSKTFFADIIGMSLYRSVAVPVLGNYQFPHTPFFYRLQGWLVSAVGDRAVISELQVEPWGLHEFDLSTQVGREEAYAAFTVQDLEDQLEFAQKTGLPEVSLWGLEWWLVLAERGEIRLWEGADRILENL